MTILTNTSMSLSNSSFVFAQQNAYTSIEMWYGVIALFAIFMVMSLYLDGNKQPFEKLVASLLALILSFSNLLVSFSLAIVGFIIGGTTNVIMPVNTTGVLNSIVPTILMQNTITWQIASIIILIICAVNVINAIMMLYDLSRKNGGMS